MKHLILFFLIVSISFGCKEETSPPFSTEKIQSILLQIHLTDASTVLILGAKKDSMTKVYMEQVKEINQVTDEEIETIFTYLKEHPKFANEIYSAMVAEVNEIQRDTKEKNKKKREERKEAIKKRK